MLLAYCLQKPPRRRDEKWRRSGPMDEKNVRGVDKGLWCEPCCCLGGGEAVAFPFLNEEVFRGPGNVPDSGRLLNNQRLRRGGCL